MASDRPSFPQDPARLTDAELVRLILAYHEAHLRDLAAAVDLARQLEADATGQGAFPAGLGDHLERMLEQVAHHQACEEGLFAPLFLTGEDRSPPKVATLAGDHEAAQADLERLVRLTGDYHPPADAGAAWRALYDLCRRYDREFREHIRLEERILFPRAVARFAREGA